MRRPHIPAQPSHHQPDLVTPALQCHWAAWWATTFTWCRSASSAWPPACTNGWRCAARHLRCAWLALAAELWMADAGRYLGTRAFSVRLMQLCIASSSTTGSLPPNPYDYSGAQAGRPCVRLPSGRGRHRHRRPAQRAQVPGARAGYTAAGELLGPALPAVHDPVHFSRLNRFPPIFWCVQEGYDLGDLPGEAGSLEGLGEAIVTALKMQDDQRAIAGG